MASLRPPGFALAAFLTMLALPLSGRAEDANARGGHLVICGGGGLPDRVRAKFVELSGGGKARLVVIPTASEAADGPPAELEEFLEPWRKQGVASARLLHTRSRDRANQPDFHAAIDEADAVWFSGGDQSHLTNAYLDTATDAALRRLLARGGVIGGTSAGAAIMSKVMITGGSEKATVGQGFGFLPAVVVDQHALKRSRLNRVFGVLADHPELAAGVSIDEGTALVVDLGHGRWQVAGESYVVVSRPNKDAGGLRLDVFHEGQQGELGSWNVLERRAE